MSKSAYFLVFQLLELLAGSPKSCSFACARPRGRDDTLGGRGALQSGPRHFPRGAKTTATTVEHFGACILSVFCAFVELGQRNRRESGPECFQNAVAGGEDAYSRSERLRRVRCGRKHFPRGVKTTAAVRAHSGASVLDAFGVLEAGQLQDVQLLNHLVTGV